MPAYTEADVSAAIDAVLDGDGLREAARKYNIPRQTMADRILGRKTNSEAKESKQRLSPDLEKKLVGFILKQESIGSALTHAQIRSLAGKILKNGGDSMPIGRHWLEGFFRRNPEIKTKRATRIDYKRVNGASPENINLFFLRLAEFSWIKPCNIFNADETGIMEGMGVGKWFGRWEYQVKSQGHLCERKSRSYLDLDCRVHFRHWTGINTARHLQGQIYPSTVVCSRF